MIKQTILIEICLIHKKSIVENKILAIGRLFGNLNGKHQKNKHLTWSGKILFETILPHMRIISFNSLKFKWRKLTKKKTLKKILFLRKISQSF